MLKTCDALVVHEHGPPGSLTLGKVEVGSPRAGEVLIEVHAAGINFADALLVSGEYQSLPELPFVPGSECAGVIVAVGDGVDGFMPGDRVLAIPLGGCFAEMVRVSALRVFHLPTEMSAAEGAGFLVTFGTVWHALLDRGRLQPGETVLVLGAGGGIGAAGIAVAKACGATVIAVVGSESKAEIAQRSGADHVLVHSDVLLKDRVRELTDGVGIDIVLDPVGGALFGEALRCLAWRGRALVIGFASGDIPLVKVNRLLLQGSEVIGVYWGRSMELEPDRFRREVYDMLTSFTDGRLGALATTQVPLADVPDVLQGLLDRRRGGKYVAVMKDTQLAT